MKKMKLKKVLLCLLVLSFSVGAIGCSSKPKGEPQATIEEYYGFIDSADYESAYDLLSSKLKEEVDLDKFSKWQSLLTDTEENMEYKFTLEEESKDLKLDDQEFTNAAKFKVNRSWKNLYAEKQEVANSEEYVVAEDKEWKVYRVKKDFNVDGKISNVYSTLGWMYHTGKGAQPDMNKAIEMFSNAIKYKESNPSHHYSLANALSNANRYDEAISSANRSIELIKEDNDSEENKKQLSDATNLLGVVAGAKGEIEKAKEYYNSALEINPDNQYAKSNLTNLN